MKAVFTAADTARVGLYQSVLQDSGSACFVQNFHNAEASVVPFIPTLYVAENADYERARQLLADLLVSDATPGPDWLCSECGEASPSNFDRCWNCGGSRGPAV